MLHLLDHFISWLFIVLRLALAESAGLFWLFLMVMADLTFALAGLTEGCLAHAEVGHSAHAEAPVAAELVVFT